MITEHTQKYIWSVVEPRLVEEMFPKADTNFFGEMEQILEGHGGNEHRHSTVKRIGPTTYW
jgi:hypothetical protein